MRFARLLMISTLACTFLAWAGPREDAGAALRRGDYSTAARLYQPLAEKGEALAQSILGHMYSSGLGVPKDLQQAAHWWLKAAEQGEAFAQSSLGELYIHGLVVPKDDRQAVYWLQKAAEQGVASAQHMLGAMHADGRGVPQDYRQAIHWFRMAAEQGDLKAQHTLGLSYAAGRGVPKDYQQAYFWMLLASSQGNAEAEKHRDALEEELTPTQRATAQAQARNWKPTARGPEQRLAPEGRENTSATASTGSGFRVATGRFVTNYHVVEGCRTLRINGTVSARVGASDPWNDLALLMASGDRGRSAVIRPTPPRLGEDVTVSGYPLQGMFSGLTVTTGTINRLSGVRADSRLLQISAPVQPGNSGGPLLDVSGNVIGVVVGKLDALKVAGATGDIPQNVNFAVNPSLVDCNA